MPLKESLFRFAKRLGLTDAVRDSKWRQQRLLVLCYHGLSQLDEHEWNPELYMSPAMFRERMRILAEGGYSVLPLAGALERLRSGTLPPRSVAITFDDGTVDFAQHAVPVLREYGFPATVYLTSYYCDHRLPVFDGTLAYILWRGRGCDVDLSAVIGASSPLVVSDASNRQHASAQIQAFVRAQGLSSLDKDALLRRIANLLNVDYDDIVRRQIIHIMPPEMIQSLPRDLIDVQLHTRRHRTPRDRQLFSREISDNRIDLQRLVGAEGNYVHFCYPSGDYDGMFLEWLSDLGVASATTCLPGMADSESDPLLLPRFVDTSSQSAIAFEAWVSGIAALLPARRGYRLDPKRLRTNRGDRSTRVPRLMNVQT